MIYIFPWVFILNIFKPTGELIEQYIEHKYVLSPLIHLHLYIPIFVLLLSISPFYSSSLPYLPSPSYQH